MERPRWINCPEYGLVPRLLILVVRRSKVRWLLLLLLVTAVWWLAHATEGARKLVDNHRRGLPPETRASFSVMPGMIVMPIASMSLAVVADRFARPWGFRVVALIHLALGVCLFSYIALAIIRARRPSSRG